MQEIILIRNFYAQLGTSEVAVVHLQNNVSRNSLLFAYLQFPVPSVTIEAGGAAQPDPNQLCLKSGGWNLIVF
jgi:hypothetical protein